MGALGLGGEPSIEVSDIGRQAIGSLEINGGLHGVTTEVQSPTLHEGEASASELLEVEDIRPLPQGKSSVGRDRAGVRYFDGEVTFTASLHLVGDIAGAEAKGYPCLGCHSEGHTHRQLRLPFLGRRSGGGGT